MLFVLEKKKKARLSLTHSFSFFSFYLVPSMENLGAKATHAKHVKLPLNLKGFLWILGTES